MTPYEHAAVFFDPVIGDHFDDVGFADFVDNVLATLAASVAGTVGSA